MKSIIKSTGVLLALAMMVLSAQVFAKAKGEFPATIKELTIVSHDKRMSGLAYLAAGKGPHPTVLLLHGYPGNEKNLDVAQALRSQGWNVVFFHYRGAWGSEGEFSFLGAEADVQVVLSYLQDENNATRLRVDRSKISLVGHSMGGHLALAGTFDAPQVKCAVGFDPANLGARNKGFFEDIEGSKKWLAYSDSLFMLNGWSGAKARAEIELHGEAINLLNRAHKIMGRPVMIIAADTDVIPMAVHIDPLVAVFKAQENNKLAYRLIEDDHSFSSSRALLIETTVEFLNQSCR